MGARPVGGGGRGQRRGSPAVRPHPAVPPQVGAAARERKMKKVPVCTRDEYSIIILRSVLIKGVSSLKD